VQWLALNRSILCPGRFIWMTRPFGDVEPIWLMMTLDFR